MRVLIACQVLLFVVLIAVATLVIIKGIKEDARKDSKKPKGSSTIENDQK